MTYCSSITISHSEVKTNWLKEKFFGGGDKLAAGLSKKNNNFNLASWLVGGLIVVNVVLGAGYAILINQATINGYRLARAESSKEALLQERMQLSVNVASQQASHGSLSLVGFEPVGTMEFLGKKTEQISLR